MVMCVRVTCILFRIGPPPVLVVTDNTGTQAIGHGLVTCNTNASPVSNNNYVCLYAGGLTPIDASDILRVAFQDWQCADVSGS